MPIDAMAITGRWVSGGGIQASTQTNLQHQHIHLIGGEVFKGDGKKLLKRGELVFLADLSLRNEQRAQICFSNHPPVDADALAPIHQMG